MTVPDEAEGSTGRGGVNSPEAECGAMGTSCLDGAGDRRTRVGPQT